MNKADLIDAIALDVGLSKAAAQRALDSMVKQVMAAVAQGESVQLVGFGIFAAGSRAERTGRNPRTGAEITIAAAKTVKFSAGKLFKDSVNQ